MDYAIYIAVALAVIVVAVLIFKPKPESISLDQAMKSQTALGRSSTTPSAPEKLSDKLLCLHREFGPAVKEILTQKEAEKGRAFTLSTGEVFFADLLKIIYSFMNANGGATYGMSTFVAEVVPTLHPHIARKLQVCPDGVVAGARQLLSKAAESTDVEISLPAIVANLNDSDMQHGTHQAVRMAQFYL